MLPTILKPEKSNSLRVSVISAWEIGILERKNRYTFFPDPLNWFLKATEYESGIKVLPLSAEIAITSSRFPEEFHNDSADRIILATAILNDFTLITKDQKILEYARKNKLNVIEP